MTEVRIDKWLWAARFFKTRSMAQKAVRGGHVQINGNACKPARSVKAGDRLRIVRGELEFDVEVLGLAECRGSAERARTLYEESPESVEKRAQWTEQKRLSPQSGARHRPDKRERRNIREFTGKTG
ncbi:MAG: RNA-binding S4 domain-containing protein [Wenzhouxiangellaceae bacterium]|nr:RNA-binding S4 domain-containing protein [Wenzhouxiangellaceae bacterium]